MSNHVSSVVGSEYCVCTAKKKEKKVLRLTLEDKLTVHKDEENDDVLRTVLIKHIIPCEIWDIEKFSLWSSLRTAK